MQTIEKILMTHGAVGQWRDEIGHTVEIPSIVLGTHVKFRIDLRSDKPDPETDLLMPLSADDLNCQSYYFALDADFLQSTAVKLLNRENCRIVTEDGKCFFEGEIPNTACQSMIAWIGNAETKSIVAEIGGFSADAPDVAAFVIQFQIYFRNRIWLGDNIPESDPANPYWTADQVIAYLGQAPVTEYSSDGENWHSVQDREQDIYRRWKLGENGAWSNPEYMASGRDGRSFRIDLIAPIAERPESPAEGFCFVASDERMMYVYQSGAWLEGIRMGLDGKPGRNGDDGENGKSAYEIAVENGYEGTVEQWLADLKGADGNAVTPDATGVLAELPLYGDKPAGFIFGATVISDEWTDVYYYAKKSDALGDWCTPMVIREYGHNGKDGKNIALLPPVEFVRDRDQNGSPIDHDYLYFNMEKYPGASIACVTIETDEGEYVLPYNSATGITKILKVGNDYRIYFGQYIPDWERGKVYLAQGGVALDAIADAPEDGNLYARCNGRWVRITGAAEEPEEPTTPTAFYGVIADGETYAVSQVTEEMLSSMTSAELTSDVTATLNVTPGSVTMILVPSGYTVTKDDGFGNRVPFDTDNGTIATGANGTTVTLDGTEYKAYGEFNLITGNTIIYIQEN